MTSARRQAEGRGQDSASVVQSRRTAGIWTPHAGLKTLLRLVAAGLVVLGLTGCGTIGKRHQDAINTANTRWLSMRSALIGKMAQQQFDAGDLDQAEKTLLNALALDPTNAVLHTLAGRVALERSHLERSYHRLQTAIELDEDRPEAPYYLGIVFQRWQQYDRALEHFRRAYELEADNAAYLLAVAEMYITTDQLDAALELLQSKMRYFDQNAGIRIAIGQVYTIMHRYDEAAEYFRKGALLRPDDLAIVEELALAQFQAGQFDQATRNLKRLCRAVDSGQWPGSGTSKQEPAGNVTNRQPSDTSHRPDLKRALAECYLQQDRLADAKAVYIKLIRQDRTDADAWAKLAQIAWTEGDEKATLLAAQRVIAVAPDRYEGYLMSGMVWQKRGRLDQAIRLFDRAADAAPDNALPLILRGLTLEQAGKTEQAAMAYTQALHRAPQDQRARKLLTHVGQQAVASGQ
ncbi:MAG: tetratricopeptide repeat protein [Phycisphaeraceae bacterium]